MVNFLPEVRLPACSVVPIGLHMFSMNGNITLAETNKTRL